jgi:hypothetical protein
VQPMAAEIDELSRRRRDTHRIILDEVALAVERQVRAFDRRPF